MSYGAAVAENQLWAQELTFDERPPTTLGNAAAARVYFIVWCFDCRHRVEPDLATMVERHGAEMTVPDWHKRLVCPQCGSRQVDFVVTGERRG